MVQTSNDVGMRARGGGNEEQIYTYIITSSNKSFLYFRSAVVRDGGAGDGQGSGWKRRI